ncbi:hypothetical protein WA577_007699, partial [Blastocystis sp. JDR]
MSVASFLRISLFSFALFVSIYAARSFDHAARWTAMTRIKASNWSCQVKTWTSVVRGTLPPKAVALKSSSIASESLVPCRLQTAVFSSQGVRRLENASDYSIESVVQNQQSVLPKAFLDKTHHYLLVMCISEESRVITKKLENTFQSMRLFMTNFNTRIIIFSSSPAIAKYCLPLGFDVVPSYLTNFAGMPLLREMYKAAKRLYSADYYGYTNSDILISASLFPILVETRRHYQNHELTDGHFVSAVVYNIFTPPSIPTESPEAYTTFINDGMHKVRPRLVYCSDFWIFHQSMDFDLIGDVVIGRGWVDNYIMGLVGTLKRSMVDVTYGAIALHQGLDTSSDRNAMKRDYSDLNFNQYCEKMQRIQGFYMSIPGDKVAYWNNDQRLVFENWNNAEGRDRKRSRLLYEV